ncbi:uncharacterized protein LY89DRAFT_673198 [Mollisia scopiformis]|uniref:Zn(2)-C6 fungal-type domain-containing protein n=1 Tax=Mollisia scopiformis TaxID=149040 RepID=A0A194WYR4_MOLSC|nr:uncharacterized protein LY89DRAFT_673198 [Mollisia scopiformis]KUJ13101.1 hypothetical protein LY89DRAFT_673198 [Mollisia scopiformis]
MSSNEALSPATTNGSIPSQLRRKHPCVLCQQRKVKCDRNEPCQNCTKARVECISPLTLPPKKRKRRFPEAELLARIRRYEDALKGYGADLDAINGEGGRTSLSYQGQSTLAAKQAETESNVMPRSEVVAQPTRSLSIRRSLRHVKNNLWTGINEELMSWNFYRVSQCGQTPEAFNKAIISPVLNSADGLHDQFRDAEEILQGSSDDELYENPISKTYDAINGDGSDFLFTSPNSATPIRDLHPSPVQIFRLWQTFIDSVNPLLKIFHAPTVQQQVLDASADLDNVDKGMEALMFGIYSISVNSMAESDCSAMFGEDKTILRERFQEGARHAFRRCGLLRSSDMTILQAFVLYLYSCLNFCIDPRSLFCLSGIAVRIAQRMGLNFDGTSYGLLPFEVEMRRRLWWQIVLLDFRISELSGAGNSILTHVWTTKLPLNVNDSDLFPDMRDPPTEHPGRVTEMIYVLQRCEAADLLQKLRDSTDPVAVKDAAIDELSKRIEQKYLQYGDPSVPLHLFSTIMARSGMCKLHIGPRHPHLIHSKELKKDERDQLVKYSLTMIENHNILMATKCLKPYLWHILTNSPFPAHIYLLVALRHHANDELSDRAWTHIGESFRLRRETWAHNESVKHSGTALQLALANLTIKAWEAREKERQGIATPDFITHLREVISTKKASRAAQQQTPTDSGESEIVSGAPADPFGGGYQWGLNEPTSMMDFGQGLDPNVMPGLMQDQGGAMGWEFWNDLMQMPAIPGFDGSAGQGVYPG